MRASIILSVLLLAACGGSDSDSGPAPVGGPVEPPAQAPGSDDLPASGFYVGYFVTQYPNEKVTYWSEAMLTADGWLYIHTVSYPGWPDSSGAVLFVGKVDQAGLGQWTPVRAIGEDCQLLGTSIGHFGCEGEPPDPTLDSVQVRLTSIGKGILEGEISVKFADSAPISLPFSLYAPTLHYIDLPASLTLVQGMYRELNAMFAQQDNMVTTVDSAGNIFFQSPANGCTGNGTLTPYLDGTLNAYRSEILMENCTGPYAYLNGPLEGFATLDCPYWWCFVEQGPDLYMWLASPEGTVSPAALTMYGVGL